MAWDDLHESKGPDNRFRGGGGPSPEDKPPFDIPQFKIPKFKPSMVLGIALLLLVVWIVPSVFYTVKPDEEGVVTRFGKFSHRTSPGLHFKFPSPIEHAQTPQVTKIRHAEIGFRSSQSGGNKEVSAESLMLTGDQNIVDIKLVVQYRIADSVAYLFNVRRPNKLVHDVAETVLRGIIGSKKIDEALTTGKAEVQGLAKEQIQTLLDKYQAGIQVVAVLLQDVDPPKQVAASFKDVVSAREDKERMINEAQGYANAVIPEARGKAAQILRQAEAYREEKIKRAEGDAKRFLTQYAEYKKAPIITRKRMYLETMEEILPEIEKYVVGGKSGGVLPILPLSKNPLLGGTKK